MTSLLKKLPISVKIGIIKRYGVCLASFQIDDRIRRQSSSASCELCSHRRRLRDKTVSSRRRPVCMGHHVSGARRRQSEEFALRLSLFCFRGLSQLFVGLLLPISFCVCLRFPFRPGNGSPSATSVVLLVLGVVVSTKAFSFHNRSSSNYAHKLVPTLSTT